MKIKRIKLIYIHKHKLLKFNLIKSKILKKNMYEKNINVEGIEIRLKRVLKLIYLYHILNKKILFIGNPIKINIKIENILSKTNHVFMPMSAWITGLLTNQKLYLKKLFKKTRLLNLKAKKLLKLKEKSDLIVIMDQKLNVKALKESESSKTPLIVLNSDLDIFNNKMDYKVPGNFILSKNKLKNNLFYSILLSTLKKAISFKKRIKGLLPYKLNSIKKIKTKKKRYKNYKKFFNKKKIFNAFSKKK